MAVEIAPFGLGVTVLVAGTYGTAIITDAGTTDDRDFGGPDARLHNTMNTRGRFAMRMARPPEKFTDGVAKANLGWGHGVGRCSGRRRCYSIRSRSPIPPLH